VLRVGNVAEKVGWFGDNGRDIEEMNDKYTSLEMVISSCQLQDFNMILFYEDQLTFTKL
jgi:hypothetical protein